MGFFPSPVRQASATVSLSASSIADLGTKDHDLLDGLADDDHTIYTLLAGRAGGQTVNGGSAASEDLTLDSTSDATKGVVKVPSGTKFLSSDSGLVTEASIGVSSQGNGMSVAGSSLVLVNASLQTCDLRNNRVGFGSNFASLTDNEFRWAVTQNGNTAFCVLNQSAGNVAQSRIFVSNDASKTIDVSIYGSNHTSIPNRAQIRSNTTDKFEIHTVVGSGADMELGTESVGRIRFISAGNVEMMLDEDFIPAVDAEGEIGTDAKRFSRGRFVTHTCNREEATVSTAAALAGDVDDYSFDSADARVLRVSASTSPRRISGIALTGGNNDGRTITVINHGSVNIILEDEEAASVAANRIVTSLGADLTVTGNDSAVLMYDGTTARWRVIS